MIKSHNARNGQARTIVIDPVSAIDAYAVKWINEPGKGYITVARHNVNGRDWDQLTSDKRLTAEYQKRIKALYASKGVEIID